MSFERRSKLGPYEILSLIGKGGMGEVYKGKDTRLDRTVAIKVLPKHLSGDAERRERFEREARAVSSLNHPHICTLHDIGEQEGTHFLVMESIEGETLADRLAKGPLPLDQALRYGIEIADALDKAHRQGVVHRDLKPGNVMLTKPGAKLLDFGLAKFKTPEAEQPASVLSALPTEQKPLTQDGAILGTFQYMAPEQLEGKEADSRADIFAFGAVLCEMVTGKKAFQGKSHASLIGAILKDDPPSLSRLQPLAPSSLDRLVRSCLAKDPEDRWQSAGDLNRELNWIAEGAPQPATSEIPRRRREGIAWTAAIIAGLCALVASYLLWRSAPEPTVQRFHVLPPETGKLQFEITGPVVSPDGQKLALVDTDESGARLLWVRSLDSLEFRPQAGTEEAAFPFWSPDSRFIGFFAQGKVKKIALDGSPPEVLCDEPRGTPRGGTWNSDGVILFSSGHTIYQVSALGGPATTLVESPNERRREINWPYFLPDGHHFLGLTRTTTEDSIEYSIVAGSVDSSEMTPLIQAFTHAVYAPPGFLLYARQGTLLAQPFDASRLQLKGEPTPIADGLVPRGLGHSGFWVSNTGVLSYSVGREFSLRPTWFNRSGQKLGYVGDPAFECFDASLSSDERLVALTCYDPDIGTSDVRIVDLSRNTSSRLTFEPDWDQWPVWSPDSNLVAFWSMTELRERSVDRRSDQKVLLSLEHTPLKPLDWSPDGEFILYQTQERGIDSDLVLVSASGSGEAEPYLSTRFSEIDGRFSPDGRWIAYASNESGRFEVYIQSFPDGDRRYQVSFDGGYRPYWRGDGRELFYIAADSYLIAVPVKMTPQFEAGASLRLFEAVLPLPDESRYGVAADGQRFLLYSRTGRAAMTVVLNWAAELTQ